ncbi:MAG: TolC family protein [Planctomycetota bacterium]
MSIARKRLTLLGLILVGGCATPTGLRDQASHVEAVASHLDRTRQTASPRTSPASEEPAKAMTGEVIDAIRLTSAEQADSIAELPAVHFASNPKRTKNQTGPKTVTIDGVTYSLHPVSKTTRPSRGVSIDPIALPIPRSQEPAGLELVESATPVKIIGGLESATPEPAPIEEPIPFNLPSVLAAIDSGHPLVGEARWRVQQAYARLDQARALWLPSIQTGFSFNRHDGNYQASNGQIVDVNKNSFQYGLGAGAVGAGTTTRPGIVARFHLADAIFLPKVTETTAWARGHAANATLNRQLLTAASAYFELVDAHQELRIVEQSRDRLNEVADITVDFAEAGEGLQSDADRIRTELALIESRLVRSEEQVAVAAARLAQAISLDSAGTIVPTDVNAVPLDLQNPETDAAALVATGLQMRPELKESQALVVAACKAYEREKYAPFVPSVLLGFSTGGFGGGLDDNLDNVDSRYDLDALLSWEVRNLGFGEKAMRRERSAQIQQAKFAKLRVMDQVAREVTESHAQVGFRRRQIEIALGAIQSAEDSYRRNLERIRDGEGLPLEVLQSAQALESAQRAYMRAVIDHNQAQIRLQWALGFPVS